MSRGGDVARTILKIVLAYARRGGRFVDCRPSVGWSSWQSKEIMSSVHWMVDSSDAPYSVVVPLWTTDGISIVCRVVESKGRAFDFGELVPSDCVLRRLSEEFFDLVSPALDTWKVVRGLMASEESNWHEVRAEELPEGLSDRGEDSRSQEEAPSVSGSSRVVGPDDSWIARSYLSKSDEVACSSKYGDVAFYEADFNAGVSIDKTKERTQALFSLLHPTGPAARGRKQIFVSPHLPPQFKLEKESSPPPSRNHKLVMRLVSLGCLQHVVWGLDNQGRISEAICLRLLESSCWTETDSPRPRGDPLKRPKLNQDGHNRVLRALHHKEHHFKHFIRPELLALYLFGPELRMVTAKLNKEKLMKMMKMMSQQEEAPLTLGKRRKTGSSSKKVVDEVSLPPPPIQKTTTPDPIPASSVEVVEVPTEPSSSRSVEKVPTLPKDTSLASRRVKTVVTKEDIVEYDKVNTDIIKVVGVHFLMKGLTELTVIANYCIQWEEALLKQKVQISEAAQANQRLTTLVNELSLDRDRVVGELSSLKGDLARREEDLRKALDGVKRADEQVKMLSSQLEAAKVLAVEEFKSSETYDDNNTKYFLSGFSLFKKQAKEKYPELDFDVFQPFEDDESMMPVDDGNVGMTSADPQMDDDATS
uniref:Uncharacterized protein n=1 Tax=Fagus sylvatica TaxID=28930 RepID=A0A2N9F2S3_FAGSY